VLSVFADTANFGSNYLLICYPNDLGPLSKVVVYNFTKIFCIGRGTQFLTKLAASGVKEGHMATATPTSCSNLAYALAAHVVVHRGTMAAHALLTLSVFGPVA
jgi:hypothetical protein